MIKRPPEAQSRRLSAVLLIGIPASGKSCFCRQHFYDSHLRINLDMLRTRQREKILLDACLTARQSFVVDNTNADREIRSRFIVPAKNAGFWVIGYYFSSKVAEALERNSMRQGSARIPDKAVLGIAGRLERPSLSEGFDQLWYVNMDGTGDFEINEWIEEVVTTE